MTKQQIIQHVLNLLTCAALTFCGWSFKKIDNIEKVQIRQDALVSANKNLIGIFTTQFERLSDAIEQMVFEQEVKNRISKYKMRDRWSAEMEADGQYILFQALSRFHPELKYSDFPDTKAIQTKYPDLSSEDNH